jgi:hypothetical protein
MLKEGYPMAAHACDLSRDKRIVIRGQPRQKLVRPYLKNKPGVVKQVYNPNYWGGRDKRISVYGLKKSERSCLRNKLKKEEMGVWLKR